MGDQPTGGITKDSSLNTDYKSQKTALVHDILSIVNKKIIDDKPKSVMNTKTSKPPKKDTTDDLLNNQTQHLIDNIQDTIKQYENLLT